MPKKVAKFNENVTESPENRHLCNQNKFFGDVLFQQLPKIRRPSAFWLQGNASYERFASKSR